MTREEIYQYLIKNLTSDNLKEVTLKVIDAYKNKNMELLHSYADQLNIDHTVYENGGNRLFLKLIKYFHPDMLSFIQKEIELSYNNGQIEKLQFYKNLISVDKKVKIPGSAGSRRAPTDNDFIYARNEDYYFDESDSGYTFAGGNEDPGDSCINEVDEEMDFINALRAAYMGNNELYLDPSDLGSIEEELVLCDYGIGDLAGLQHCVNVTSLNLSYNNISSIYEIKKLTGLRELFVSNNRISDIDYLKNLPNLEIIDISFNEIDNIDALLHMDNLKLADVRNNPLKPEHVFIIQQNNDTNKAPYIIF